MIEPKPNKDEIRDKLIEKLRPSGWVSLLKGFFQSTDFDRLLDELYLEVSDGKRFTPLLKDVFRAFEECPLKETKVIMISQDPYAFMMDGVNVADGIAFSCSKTGVEQPSIKYIMDAIERTVPKDSRNPGRDVDLKRWANQGVLTINSALTTQINKVGTHYKIWKSFITYTMDLLNAQREEYIFVFVGKKSQELEPIIGTRHKKLFVVHPAAAAYKNLEEWDCSDVFNKINTILTEQNKKTIIW